MPVSIVKCTMTGFNKRHSLRRIKDKIKLMEMRAAGRYVYLLKSMRNNRCSIEICYASRQRAQFNRHSAQRDIDRFRERYRR